MRSLGGLSWHARSASAAETVRLGVRRAGVDEVDLDQPMRIGFDGALPWRTFRWRQGQAHYSGQCWSSAMPAALGAKVVNTAGREIG
jgi:hypothetical protein